VKVAVEGKMKGVDVSVLVAGTKVKVGYLVVVGVHVAGNVLIDSVGVKLGKINFEGNFWGGKGLTRTYGLVYINANQPVIPIQVSITSRVNKFHTKSTGLRDIFPFSTLSPYSMVHSP
jgi:hypothetical protein